jgi:4-hydroxy-3-polyprenylbenzoate decarboxylase
MVPYDVFPCDRAQSQMDLIVGITGASGVRYGVGLLEAARALEIDTHLVITPWGEKTLRVETSRKIEEIKALATHAHRYDNLAAPIASGSYLTQGMAIVPCTVNTLAAIAGGFADNLLSRAADVTLKERRPLVLAVRETPLSILHLRNMLALAEMGATIMPPVPAFYANPSSLDQVVAQFVSRVLDQFGVANELSARWPRAFSDAPQAGAG